MTTQTHIDPNRQPSKRTLGRGYKALLLGLGAALSAASATRWGIGLLAWIAPVPFLYYLLITRSRLSKVALLGALVVSSHITVMKIVTPPLSYAMTPLFALPAALITFASLLIWDAIRKRAGRTIGIYAYPAIIVVAEWAQYAFTELGSWGSLAYTQLDNLPFLQSASIFGITGMSFVMSWASIILAEYFLIKSGVNRTDDAYEALKPHAIAFGAVLTALVSYGTLRLAAINDGPTVTAAAVSTDLVFKEQMLPSKDVIERTNDTLIERTIKAGERGAKLVVWNEVATVVEPADEAALVSRAIETAKAKSIDLVMAYGVLLSSDPVKYENKYKLIRSNGTIAEEYFKHHPVPGEPTIKGTAPLAAIKTPYGNIAGAICYDYDFPGMSLGHAKLNADLVFVPSSDWLGIYPFHTQMASVRGIEGGYSVLRSTRANISAGYDAYGRVRAEQNYFEPTDRIMLAQLPVKRVETIYGTIGDLLPYTCAAFLLGAAAIAAIQPAKKTCCAVGDKQGAHA